MQIDRARWCEAIVVLSEIIRSSAGSSANARISNLSSLATAAKILAADSDDEDKDEDEDEEVDKADNKCEDENEVSYADDHDLIVAERKVKLAAKLGIEPKYSAKEATEVIEVI